MSAFNPMSQNQQRPGSNLWNRPKQTEPELILRGKIAEQEGKEIEIRTLGKRKDYKSYCYVLEKGTGFGTVELETYRDEMDAREGHLRWLRQRDRCLSYLQAQGILRRHRA